MSYNTGYVTLPTNTYAIWKNAVNGNGYNYDNTYGCQCYDLVVEFWWNVGFPEGFPRITDSSAYTMWNNRLINSTYNGIVYFDLIYNLNNVKQGDILVYSGTTSNPYGHVGFADEDYSTWHANNPSSYEFPILSENNGGTPDPQGGAYTNVHGYDTRLFLGAFRYRAWHSSPTPIGLDAKHAKKRFPFVLYARQLRNKM